MSLKDFKAKAALERQRQELARHKAWYAHALPHPIYGPIIREILASYPGAFVHCYSLRIWYLAKMLAPVADWKAIGVRSNGNGCIPYIALDAKPGHLPRQPTHAERVEVHRLTMHVPEPPTMV